MSADLELLTVAEMAQADRLAPRAGIPSMELMERAGRAVAVEAAKMAPTGARIGVLCGPGNNGGDGFVAARLLAEGGYRVDLALLADESALKGDAAIMAARWSGPVASDWSALLDERPALVIDALFGAGLSRPLGGNYAAAVDAMGQARETHGAAILAVDIPSGIHGDSGQPIGAHAVSATRTITFFRRKPGHLLLPGRAHCGAVVVADIGIPSAVFDRNADCFGGGFNAIDCRLFANAPALWRSAWPHTTAAGHKYTRGHAVVVSGPPECTGAARLGARGALRAGAGLVTVATSRAAFPVNAAHLTAIMLEQFEVPDGLAQVLADRRRNAVLIGPGAGVTAATARMVRHVLASGAAAVLDADALTSFAADASEAASAAGPLGFLPPAGAATRSRPEDLFAAIAAEATRSVVLTPHEGEFRRLFSANPGAVSPSASKLERARAAARICGAVVILKGADTVIASPDGRAAINENAPPWLATAGSGDVLAGLVTGLLAQGMPAFEAAAAGVWLHGAAALAFGPGLIAEDLPETLPAVLRALQQHVT